MFGIEGDGNGYAMGLYGSYPSPQSISYSAYCSPAVPFTRGITHPNNGSYQTIAPPPLIFNSPKFATHQISDAQNPPMVSGDDIT